MSGEVEEPGVFATGAGGESGAAASGENTFPRDKDPPPSYDGVDPENTFRSYEKSVRLWQFETDVAPKKQGAKLLRALSGIARLAVEEMEFDEIATEEGAKNVLSKLREFFVPHLEVSMPRAFEAAVYGQVRQPKESFIEYVARMDRAFVRLEKEGVKLPDDAKGYITYRHASLTESQEQRVQTWTEGKYDRKEIIQSLRKLDKVLKEKGGKSHYLLENEADSEYAFHQEMAEGDLDDDDGSYVYIAEGDLDTVMEEDAVMEALASYREVRQALRDQKVNRGFYPNKGRGKGFGQGKGKGKQRVHIEQLKLRTRCNRCGAVGHWARECGQPRQAPAQTPSTSGSQVASSSAPSARSGFFVASADAGDNSSFWLRQFMEQRAAMAASSDSDGSAAYKGSFVQGSSQKNPPFCGIITRSTAGIVDTAAESGLIGSHAFERLVQQLHMRGMRVQWTRKKAAAKGVGGDAVAVGVAMIPIGLGGQINGVLETTVVQGDVPFLLPVSLLKALQVVLDFRSAEFRAHCPEEVKVPMESMPSGHVTIEVTQFAPGKFEVPPEAGRGEDFVIDDEVDGMEAMLAQRATKCFQFENVPAEQGGHGVVDESSEDAGAGSRQCADATSNRDGMEGPRPKTRTAGLENHPRQDLRGVDFGRPSRGYGRMVSAAVTFGAIYHAVAGQVGRSLCGDRCDGRPSLGASQVQEGPTNGSKFMPTPEEGAPGWGKWGQLVHRVPLV